MSGYIDNYARPENPVVDITGQPLNIFLHFADKGTSSPRDHSLSAFTGLLNVPPTLIDLLNKPLSQIGDEFWAQNVDLAGKTQRDRTAARIKSEIISGVRTAGANLSAADIHVSLPATGSLKALVLSGSLTNPDASQLVLLSYQLNSLSAEFTVILPRISNPILGLITGLLPDPTFRVTFDVELLIFVFVPLAPGPFPVSASFSTLNADIHSTNVTGGIGEAILDGISFLTGGPGDIFQGPEGQLDTSENASGNLGKLNDLLSQVGSIWPFASGTLGFKQLDALIDSQPALVFRFSHPVDPAPTVVNAADSPFPSLFHPVLGTDASIVKAGNSIVANGSYFPLNQSTQLLIGWNDTTSGQVTQSDIRWGLVNGQMNSASKPRKSFDNQNFFVAQNLIPGSSYVFSVKDEDLLTETPFSDSLTIATQSTNQIELLLALQGGGPQIPVGSASLGPNGVFSSTVVIPADLASGIYTLSAVLAGSILANTGIRVIGAGEVFPPTLEALDPTTNSVVGGVTEGEALKLRGSGFRAGEINLTVDTNVGTSLGTATGDANGNFLLNIIWPLGVIGNHSAVAEQTVGGPPILHAEASLFVQLIPR